MSAGIFELLHVPRGRRCAHPGCGREVVPLTTTTCGQCERPMPVVWGWNRLAVVGGLALLFAITAWAIWGWTERRAEARRSELLVAASREFHHHLQGARATQVETLADRIQQQYGLALGERGRLLEMAAPVIAELPREVTPEIERSVEARLRGVYRDLELEPEEAAELSAFGRDQRLAEADIAAIEKTLLDRMRPAAEHLRRGRSLVERRMFTEAETEYRRAAEIDPGDPLTWAQLGAVLAGLGRSEESFDCYERALGIDPRCWLAHYNLAIWHARQGEETQALSRLEQTLGSLPTEAAVERRAVLRALLEEPVLADLRDDPRFVDLVTTGAQP